MYSDIYSNYIMNYKIWLTSIEEANNKVQRLHQKVVQLTKVSRSNLQSNLKILAITNMREVSISMFKKFDRTRSKFQ